MTLALNGIRAGSVRLVTPWSGAWSADVDLDLGELLDLPTGPAVLVIDRSPLVCTIDPTQSGRFGPRARARAVAGAGGWEKTVGPKSYHNDGGVISTAVLATTAAEVLERIVEPAPTRFGIDFIRAAGPASSVLAGLPWRVDDQGTTIVAPRVPTPATPDVQVLEWDARTKVATIAADGIVRPGTILTDPRFGQAKIRDVEQTWGDSGSRATAYTIAIDEEPERAGGELVDVLRAIAKDAVGADFLARVEYRVVSQLPDGRFILKAPKDALHPDLRAISLAPAVPGMSVKVPPGTVAHVAFVDGDRSQPVVVGFESGTPIEITIDPSLRLAVGGATAVPVAMAPAVGVALSALVAYVAAAAPVLAAVATATPPQLAGAATAASAVAGLSPTLLQVPSKNLHAKPVTP